MNYVKAVIGGLIGGLLGMAIWIAVGYFLNVEIGWIAWGVGFLAGMGVRVLCSQQSGTAYGIIVACVIVGKYLVVSLIVGEAVEKQVAEMTQELLATGAGDDVLISDIADEIVEQRKAAGETVVMPPNVTDETPWEESYPEGIWQEAVEQWNSLSQIEQGQRRRELKQRIKERAEEMAPEFSLQGFKESLSPYDLLWLFLAAATAFRLGAGMDA